MANIDKITLRGVNYPIIDSSVPAYVRSITQADIINWNNKLDTFTETDPTIPSYVRGITQQNINSWNNKLDSFTETDPTVPSYVKGIKETDITNWNSKTDNVGTITGINMNGASKGTSGVVDLGTVLTSHQDLSSYISYTQANSYYQPIGNYLTEHQSLSSYVTSGYYDTSTHKIYLRHGTDVLSEIDANDFIKDGMVDTAYVQGSYLVISFNGDADKIPVEVPISDIFNPNNYYTAAQINSAAYLQSETDPVFSASAAAGIQSSDITNWNSKTNNTGTITGITMNGASKGTSGVVDLGTVVTSETDPVFSASAAAGIQSSDITNWNSKTNNTGTITGITMNGASKGTSGVVDLGTVITSYTETDPVFTASVAYGITSNDIANWNAKLSSFTETDPVFTASAAHGISSTDITNWNAKLTKAQADGYYTSYAYIGSLADLTTAELNTIFS